MTHLRRPFRAVLAASFVVPFAAGVALAEFPTRPITAIVPFPAGGSTDLMGRSAAQEFSRVLGVDMPVTNVGGGAGTVGTAQIARARPDGYTIGVIPAAPLINQPHMRETPYSIEDFDYICKLFHSPQALALRPDSPFSSLQEVVEHARENPGALTYGSPGPGSLPHLAMELFLEETGVQIEHVPFQGDGPGVTALMGGHIDMYMAIFSNVGQYELDAVAIFSEERVDTAPDLPTASEEGFSTTASWWGGIFAPAGLPNEVRATLEDACAQVAESETFQETLARFGSFVAYRDSDGLREEVEEGSRINSEILSRVLD